MIYYAFKNGRGIYTESDIFEAASREAAQLRAAGSSSDESPEAVQVPFKEIGIGLPLTISIREVYTGEHPAVPWWMGARKDMLVTSAVKSVATYAAKPMALNFLTRGVSPKTRMRSSDAASVGTPILFYSPALTERSLTLDLSMVFDAFPEELFQGMSNAFNATAGVPIFLTSSAYLIAAGSIVKIAGRIGESLFDGKPAFEASEPIHIDWPGEVPAPPGFALITPRDIDRQSPGFRRKHSIKDGTLVDHQGRQYAGEIPYIIISLDGKSDDALAGFTPTAASAAILSRFFGLRDGQSRPLDTLVDALKVYNDLHFRQEVDRIDEELGQIRGSSDADKKRREELQGRRRTFLKNISSKELRPPDAPAAGDPPAPTSGGTTPSQ
ncbi:hypothetical protein OJF2_46660 [Aquisphaera giovannonii]|uniref:Uncharacterized protein n=2 Tax=Aquisphaera giovannonii TaxID=406548 RepID=A0A5B9W604_9BACT|nr:hypothetical protein OJF2_46660 [Aquisphaera giovannonii]